MENDPVDKAEDIFKGIELIKRKRKLDGPVALCPVCKKNVTRDEWFKCNFKNCVSFYDLINGTKHVGKRKGE